MLQPQLSEGALDKIMSGEKVERPVLQLVGHQKHATSTCGDRYRLFLSDGIRSDSYALLATPLNELVTSGLLSQYTVIQIRNYTIIRVNVAGTQKPVMVILNIDILVPGNFVGKVLGSVSAIDAAVEAAWPAFCNTLQASPVASPRPTTHQPVVPQALARAGNTPKKLSDLLSLGGGDIDTTPISDLSPYHSRWIIKARVSNKTSVRTWSNARGEGKLFNFDLLDASGEIRCTAFREQCDKFYDMIEIGKIYYITRGLLKPANKQFNSLKNDYEMTIGNDAEIVVCNEASENVPDVVFNFVPLAAIEHKQKDELIDVLGIVKFCSEVTSLIIQSTGQELKKRDLGVVDENNDLINVTLWGQQAMAFKSESHPVIAMKGVKIGEFQGGKNLSMVASSLFHVDPDLPQAHRLRGWFETLGVKLESRSISRVLVDGGSNNGPWLTLKEAAEKRFGHADQPHQFMTKATVDLIRDKNALYKACPSEGCMKKVVQKSNGMYRCEKCQEDYLQFSYRFFASANLVDWSGNTWVIAFNEQAQALVGASAQELGELKDQSTDAYVTKIKEAAFKSYIFKLRRRQETHNGETRLKTTVVSVQPMNYKIYTNHLIDKIKELANVKS